MTEIKTSEGKEVKRKRSVEKYRLYKNNFIQSHYVSYSIRVYQKRDENVFNLLNECGNVRQLIINALWKEYDRRKKDNDGETVKYEQTSKKGTKEFKPYCLRLSKEKEGELIEMLDNTKNKCGFICDLLKKEYEENEDKKKDENNKALPVNNSATSNRAW